MQVSFSYPDSTILKVTNKSARSPIYKRVRNVKSEIDSMTPKLFVEYCTRPKQQQCDRNIAQQKSFKISDILENME